MLTVPAGGECPLRDAGGDCDRQRRQRADQQLDGLGCSIGGEAESATFTEKSYVPAVVGVPLSTPAGLSDSPSSGVNVQRRHVHGNRGGAVAVGKGVVDVVAGGDPNGRRKPGHGRAVVERDVPVGIQHGLEVDGNAALGMRAQRTATQLELLVTKMSSPAAVVVRSSQRGAIRVDASNAASLFA